MNLWLAVFLGGGVGSIIRYAISLSFQRMEWKGAFPLATLITNLISTALLAWLMLRWQLHLPERAVWRALLAVGVCGGFSTFSTFSYENFQLLREGLVGYAVANIAVSVAAGILLFYLFARTA